MTVIDWLLDSDPAIRWQVMRDLTDLAPDEVAAERARVAIEGWGAQLLAAQGPDGQWDGGTYRPATGASPAVGFRDFSGAAGWIASWFRLRGRGVSSASR